jgi:hypothetical protein
MRQGSEAGASLTPHNPFPLWVGLARRPAAATLVRGGGCGVGVQWEAGWRRPDYSTTWRRPPDYLEDYLEAAGLLDAANSATFNLFLSG